MQEQLPQSEYDVLQAQFDAWVEHLRVQLNWMDLAAFLMGGVVILLLLFFSSRKKKRRHFEELTYLIEQYEDEVEEAKETIDAFQKKLQGIEKEHTLKVHQIEQGHREVLSEDEQSLYEMKQEIQGLRQKQLEEVQAFQEEIQKLKEQIATLHQGHTNELERAEMEISDLRKQMRALMYKV